MRFFDSRAVVREAIAAQSDIALRVGQARSTLLHLRPLGAEIHTAPLPYRVGRRGDAGRLLRVAVGPPPCAPGAGGGYPGPEVIQVARFADCQKRARS
jgi:hypothetical protein